jgi:peroxiredoxin
MRRVVEFGLGCRFLGLALLACAITAGCSAEPAPKASSAATKTEPKPEVAADSSTVASKEPATSNKPATEDLTDTAAPADASVEVSAAARNDASEPLAREASEPQTREAAKPVIEDDAGGVPPVMLSAAHSKLCKIVAGDSMPAVELSKLDGGNANLESLAGSKATVVLFWTKDHWMSETALRDLARDVAGRYPNDAVAIVGIAVNLPPDEAQQTLAATAARFPQLIDADGKILAQVGEGSLPRIYVLDGQRRIAWFDIEYSEATRRELHQTLASLAGETSK